MLLVNLKKLVFAGVVASFFISLFVIGCGGGGGDGGGGEPLTITAPVLPSALSGQAYAYTLTATGGTGKYSCTLKAGSSLPWGFSLSKTCQITGTAPVVADVTISPTFVITLTDEASPAKTVEFAPLSLTVVLHPPVLTFSPQPQIFEGTGGSINVTATGGSAPYHFQFDTFLNGTPPFGTTVNLSTGTVTIPKTVKQGSYSFGVCAVDLAGRTSCKTTTVTVSAPPPIVPASCLLKPACGTISNGIQVYGGIVPASCGGCPTGSTLAGKDNVTAGGPWNICTCN